MRIQSWKAMIFYVEIYEITEMRDGCIYKTKSLGYTHKDDKRFDDSSKYVKSSLSTRITNKEFCDIELIP